MAKRQVRTLPEIHVDIGSHNVGRAKNPKLRFRYEVQYIDNFGHVKREGFDKISDAKKFAELEYYPLEIFDTAKNKKVWGATQPATPFNRGRNPAPRIGTSRPTRASQRTGQKPTKRLVSRRKVNTRAGYFPNPEPLNIKHPKNIIAAPFWIYQTYNGKREFIAATKSAATGNALAGLMQKNAKAGAFFDVVKAY